MRVFQWTARRRVCDCNEVAQCFRFAQCSGSVSKITLLYIHQYNGFASLSAKCHYITSHCLGITAHGGLEADPDLFLDASGAGVEHGGKNC